MTVLAMLSNDDNDLSPNVGNTKETLTEHLDSLSVVTAYSHAVVNTVINPVSTPPESWFAPLNTNLNTAKTHAMTWITDIAPDMGAVIPQSIINYSNDFNAATGEILRILDAAGSRPLTAAETTKIIDLIEATLASVEEQSSAVATIKTKVLTLARDFQTDHENLVTGQHSAASAVSLAEGDMNAITNKIGELQTKLDAARAKVTASGIGLGLSIFICVAAFALAVASGGAGVGLIVAGGVGFVGMAASATTLGIFSAETSALSAELYEQQRLLSDKKKQVAALSGLHDTVNRLKAHNEEAKTALTNIQTMWNTLGLKLKAVSDNLKKGKDFGALQRSKIVAARTSWDQASDWAQKIQDSASGTQVLPPQHDKRLRLVLGTSNSEW
jgi:hypothetical protein